MMSMIALSMGGISVVAQAQTDQQKEIEQLRQEVQALRGLIEQQKVQNAQTATAIANVQRTAAAPVAHPVLKTAKAAEFNLYGNVRLDASYQVEGGAKDMPYNQINGVSLEGNKEQSDRLRSTLSATRLGLDFKSPVGDQDVKGKIEVDFLGGANLDNLRIRHAYLNYGNWLIGQTWSNFAIPDYMPETIDALAYVGGAVKRSPQVRYTTKFSPQTNLVLAAEDPKDSSINQRLPALTARLNHQFADNLNVSVRAMGHEKRVNSDEEMAWGVGVGAKYDVVPGTTLKADYYHVKGDSSFVSFTNKGVAVTALDKDKGTITADSRIAAQSEFDSIMVGITQKFGDKVHGTLGYGYMSSDKDPNYIAATPDKTTINKDLWQTWANVFYSPRKPLSFGLEYVYGEREAFGEAANGSKTGEDNRLNLVAIYNF
ncbi:porin [Acinetobacter sp. KAM398]|nr:porin [Acinetobacter sp. KAM392]GJC35041.1 porin [Acinetobacter sp. KAM393]GJC37829.1 porin [Acinetobacter sp. KAM394]GJC40689.1 porin [Acinetobacter sp. KAM395]GJC43518.1 porin [Acinetobacter sp. KAM396]GJC46360.1 porin [Acinetobacter sp. KAM397]GJC49145.1 porin [Acinetobacter sp. KAM398]GJC51951.1 porin [Acinetobacter sp. KAM399]GJC54809.1 porin [Acinetobacter sp. KAM400]GJC57642.1 porin [Acinetobacter sp. KAM401]GJC60423.1 porin [Acinetobacter sp. KAM402]GJC63306.1 porin [Acinetoba